MAILQAHIEGMRAALGFGRYQEDARCPYDLGTAEQEAWAAGLKEVLEPDAVRRGSNQWLSFESLRIILESTMMRGMRPRGLCEQGRKESSAIIL